MALYDLFQLEATYRIVQLILVMLSGILILRLAGRKSVAQITFPTLVVGFAYGTLMIQPFVLKDQTLLTLILLLIMVGVLIALEKLQIRFNSVEKFITGTAIALVDDGKILNENLKRTRVTIDQLEMYMRQKGVSNISDCKSVTLEPNGKIGYKLKKSKQPITNEDFDNKIKQLLGENKTQDTQRSNIFDEVKEEHNNKDIEGKFE